MLQLHELALADRMDNAHKASAHADHSYNFPKGRYSLRQSLMALLRCVSLDALALLTIHVDSNYENRSIY
jgi:hypothetical protein